MATVKVGLGQDKYFPKGLHAGPNTVICKVSLSLTLSVGDIHIIGKLPQGAIPLDAVFYPGAALNQSILKFGTSASQELFFSSASFSALVRTSRGSLATRQQVSVSDDVAVRYENIVMVGTAGVSVGHVCDLVVTYVLDNVGT